MISSFLSSRSASQSRTVPFPSLASRHWACTAGLDARRSESTTRKATFLLLMMSIWVAI
ncbi:hypothetical protein D9M71_800500 [compost metagenome]